MYSSFERKPRIVLVIYDDMFLNENLGIDKKVYQVILVNRDWL